MPVPTDLTLIEDALKELGFVEDERFLMWNKSIWARIEGRVVIFGIEGYDDEMAYGVLSLEGFEPSDVMEVFYHNRGMRSLQGAYKSLKSKYENRMAMTMKYCDAVMKYFNDRDVPVVWKWQKVDGNEHNVASFQIETEVRSRRDVVELFVVAMRADGAAFFEFDGGHSILVDGDDAAANCALVFVPDMLDFAPENPVDRVDYSSSYHYRHIVNAIPDMLRVGVKSVVKSTSNIVAQLDNKPSWCSKHFKPYVIGIAVDYYVNFQSSIHPTKKWNEQ